MLKKTGLNIGSLRSVDDAQEGFASIESASQAVSVSPPVSALAKTGQSQEESPIVLKPAADPKTYSAKLTELHKALLQYQKAMAAISPTDDHLRRGMRLAYESLIAVLDEVPSNA